MGSEAAHTAFWLVFCVVDLIVSSCREKRSCLPPIAPSPYPAKSRFFKFPISEICRCSGKECSGMFGLGVLICSVLYRRDHFCGKTRPSLRRARDQVCGARSESATASAERRDHFCGLYVQPIEFTRWTYPQNATTSAVPGQSHRRDHFCGARSDCFCGGARDHFCGATALKLSTFI
jgi:hypothetical protein